MPSFELIHLLKRALMQRVVITGLIHVSEAAEFADSFELLVLSESILLHIRIILKVASTDIAVSRFSPVFGFFDLFFAYIKP